jgi:hypothetical protein
MNANPTPNTIVFGALVSGALSLLAAGSLMTAPVAKADIDFECKPGCWGALAASPSNGQEEIVTNATTQQKAEDKAVLWCDVLGKTNDCDVVTSGLGCLSLAESADGKTLAGRIAPTQTRLMRQPWTVRGPGRRSTSTTAAAGCKRARRLMRRLITSRGPSWPLRTVVVCCVRRHTRR